MNPAESERLLDFTPATYHGLPVVVEIAAVDFGYVISIYSLLTGSEKRIAYGAAHDPKDAQRVFQQWSGVAPICNWRELSRADGTGGP